MEETAGERGLADGLDTASASALAEDHDVVRVAAELGDILLDPLQGLDLVEDTVVAGHTVRAFGGELRVGQEAEHTEAVVDGHEDDVLLAPGLGIELRLGTPAFAVTATMDPEGHGELLVGLAGGLGPDVQVEAVLAVGSLVAITPLGEVTTGILDGLIARMTEFVAEFHSLPGNDRLGLLPTVLTDRRSGIGNAPVHEHTGNLRGNTFHLTSLDGEDRRVNSLAAPEQGEHGQQKKCFFHIDLKNWLVFPHKVSQSYFLLRRIPNNDGSKI